MHTSTGTFGSRPLGRALFFTSLFNNYYISSQHLGRFFLKVELGFFKVEGHKGLGSNSYRTLKTREPLRDRALFVALICGAERPKKFIEAIKCYESLVCTSGKCDYGALIQGQNHMFRDLSEINFPSISKRRQNRYRRTCTSLR